MARVALRGTSWSRLVDYASPALFDVIPARALLEQSRELFSNRANVARFSDVREHIGSLLRQRNIDVELTHGPRPESETPLIDLPEHARREVGQRILEIYFTQVFWSGEALLDVRADKFARRELGSLTWRPGALYLRWQPGFLDGIRGLYLGFYLDDDALFARALEQLDMAGSSTALRDLLGREDPRNTVFDIQAFHARFHELFLSQRARGVSLHRNFLPLGVCLASLYETLDTLGVPLDVKAAFDRGRAQLREA